MMVSIGRRRPFGKEKWALENAFSTRKGDTVREFTKAKYTPTLAEDMISFFESYDQSFGAPSFEKFARARGITLSELQRFRRYKKFDAAYRECGEIRRDYLVDNALARRFDPTFVRHLLSEEREAEGEGVSDLILRVIE